MKQQVEPVNGSYQGSAGEHLERRTSVAVNDGRLTVEVGGTAGSTTLNYIVVATAE